MLVCVDFSYVFVCVFLFVYFLVQFCICILLFSRVELFLLTLLDDIGSDHAPVLNHDILIRFLHDCLYI